jgi:acyl transferase domain-containing protein
MSGDAIAIVGMAGRFPGASDVDDLWANLLDEVCSVREFGREELAAAGVPADLLDDPRYVRSHGWLDGLDRFDAGFFGYPDEEAALIDPQHRLFLEVAWHAMQDAGFRPDASRAAVGVFAGASVNRYFLRHILVPGESEMPPGHAADYLPLRVAHKLGLTGPCVAVQAACASSLAAVCLAAQSLLDYRCDIALAGGASVASTTPAGHLARDGGLLSADGVLRPFDAAANGTVYGSGAGAVVLQRLEDVPAGLPVYAVMRGWAITNDGARRAGFATPAVAGLAEAVAEAWAAADAGPADIGFVEAHGSGTPIGDALEVTALGSVFRGGARRCLLGSVKANLGNLDAAAGIASLIKAALAVRHRVIPATPHHGAPHPELELAGGPFEVAVKTGPWPADAPDLAGVTSIGLGGTNVHIVLGPAEGPPPQGITRRGLPLTTFERRRHWIEPGGPR